MDAGNRAPQLMDESQMVLKPLEARKFYDRFGRKQDSQGFYEDAALEDLITHAQFEDAESIFEFGCGTGRFATHLLMNHLPSSASYFGIDISTTMIDIASKRISPFGKRTAVALSKGEIVFPMPDHSVDRVVSTYVLDLLSESDIQQAISEAHRLLRPNGKLCLVSLTEGKTLPSRIVSGVWSVLFQIRASTVGGCRPIQLESFINKRHWKIEYRNLVTRFGVPSEVLIASPAGTSSNLLNSDVS